MPIIMPVELYTDGSSLRNPGASGLAYIIRYWIDNGDGSVPISNTIEGNQGFRLSTNNRMEIMAGIWGIRAIISKTSDIFNGITQINLFTDSEYFAKAVNQRWINKWVENNWVTSGFNGSKPKPVKNKDLWEQVIELQKQLQSMGICLTITHVQGHADNEFNNKADQLAVAAANGTNHLIDECYEQISNVLNRR